MKVQGSEAIIKCLIQEGVDTILGQSDESLEWRHELDEQVSV